MMSLFNVSGITSKIQTTSAKDWGGGRNEIKRRGRERQKDKKQNKKGKGGRKNKGKGKKKRKEREKKSTLHQLTRVIVKLLRLLWQSALKITESAFWVPQFHEAEVISTHITYIQ